MSKIVQISPCSGWFHVAGAGNAWTIHYIAAWAILENGDVVGLVPVAPNERSRDNPKLVPAPSGGNYVPESKLSTVQKLTLQPI